MWVKWSTMKRMASSVRAHARREVATVVDHVRRPPGVLGAGLFGLLGDARQRGPQLLDRALLGEEHTHHPLELQHRRAGLGVEPAPQRRSASAGIE